MNREKWSDPTMPLGRLVAKLAEETGEVAKAFGDAEDALNISRRRGRLQSVINECEHVIFIAEQVREQSLALMTTRVR